MNGHVNYFQDMPNVSQKCQLKKIQPTCDTKTKNDAKKRVSVAA